jgi:hypothetical protein
MQVETTALSSAGHYADVRRWIRRFSTQQMRGVRWTSRIRLGELPLVAVATGPDPERREMRGHAKAIIAIGDIATGIVAFGGVARGGLAIGGLALGLISLGGLSIGALGLGGLAFGCFAVGGAAIGGVAMGGLAVGYYAVGGVALGPHAFGPLGRTDAMPEWLARLVSWIRF